MAIMSIEITKDKYEKIARGITKIFPKMSFPKPVSGLEFRLKGKDYKVK